MNDEEMITIPLKELKYKNECLWLFVTHHFSFASGNLDKYLELAVEKEKWERRLNLGSEVRG
jgi:hypothetical protein